MSRRLMLFPSAVPRDSAVDRWLQGHPGPLGAIAKYWFEVMRGSGRDVTELLHDGHPTACVGEAAFAYVNVFTNHVNVGFFLGAELNDPMGLLDGAGRFMRHVKVVPGREVDEGALKALVVEAYTDMRRYMASLRRE